MVLRSMTNEEAAVLLVDMISDLRMCGYDNQSYHNAVVIACAELMKNTEEREEMAEYIDPKCGAKMEGKP